MLTQLRPALVLFLLLSLITGVIYPLVITSVAQVAFAQKANGSMMTDALGKPNGSSLVGQEFGTSNASEAPALAKWFWGRPSATSPVPYTALNLDNGTGSSGSNLAPTNPVLLDNIRARIAALDAADESVGIVRSAPGSTLRTTAIPIDLVTTSASGIDPHISPAAAEYQVSRIAKARAMTENDVREIVRQHTAGRTFSVLGEPVVHVLMLNEALQRKNLVSR